MRSFGSGPAPSEWPFTIEGGYGDIGLRKAKRRVAALNASDVLHRAVGTHRDTWRLLMLAVEIKHTADRVSDGMIDTARIPVGETNGVRGQGHRRPLCSPRRRLRS